MVSALYIRRDSIYKKMGLDCYDEQRDARNYAGPNPVIAHPPCRSWGNLSWNSNGSEEEKRMAFHAIEMVRRWGGVLEHPVTSKLWKLGFLPVPGFVDDFGGYSIVVNQSWFGHKAVKKTFLYIVGCAQRNLPDIPYSLDAIEYVIASSRRQLRQKCGIREVTKREREETPARLATWLVQVAEKCKRDDNEM
jgi:hypothetical protein